MNKKIAILGAMKQEVEPYINRYSSNIHVGFTGVGKTNAAAYTQKIISEFKPKYIFFIGLGGALDENLKIGDLGIVDWAIDAEIDVRSWSSNYQRGEVPFTKQRIYDSNIDLIISAKYSWFSDIKPFDARVATGSKFLNSQDKKEFVEYHSPELRALGGIGMFPNVYDMEGSAFLQVANKNNIPGLLLRIISDSFSGDCPNDFNKFMKDTKKIYLKGLDRAILELKGRKNGKR